MNDLPLSLMLAVDDLPATGSDVVLNPDAQVRTAIADYLDLRMLPTFSAHLHVQPRAGGRVVVTGKVSARVGQTCVVSLEPMESEVSEIVEVEFAPPELIAKLAAEIDLDAEQSDPPDPIEDGKIDVGALALEFLALGIDPYPRRNEATLAVRSAPVEEVSPFAALLQLKSGKDQSRD